MKILRNILAVLFILAGLGIFLFPTLSGLYAQHLAQQEIDKVQQMVTTVPAATTTAATDPANPTEPTEPTEPVPTEPSEMDLLFESILSYNQKIFEEKQKNFRDPFSYQNPPLDLREYGFESNVIGTLWIPRLELELPLYLGATKDNLALGAAVLGETSLPASGDNTNVAIAAHRGWRGAPMFRDIQKIQLEDKITITTPWETLVYRVFELEIITPDETDEVLIQPGRNMLTLMTCHPYTKNYQRYLVRAELSNETPIVDKEADLQEAKDTFSDAPQAVTAPGSNGESTQILVDSDTLEVSPEETGMEDSDRLLWLEQVAPIVVVALLILLIILKICKHRKDAKE